MKASNEIFVATQFEAQIKSNLKINKGHYLLTLKVPIEFKDAQPGQFVHIRVSELTEPLLRRPLSIHRAKGSEIEIFYKTVGVGTKILSQKKAGEYLNIIGPLGNGFSIRNTRYPDASVGTPNERSERRSSLLVAGGMGIAPLLFLAQQTRIKYPGSRIQILIGAKTKNHIFCEKEFKELGCEVKVATEDGSRGFKGKATELLTHLLSPPQRFAGPPRFLAETINHQPPTIYACGPKPMLAELGQICQKNKIPAQVSLEEFMGCGIGACLGCAIKTKDGYKRVCKDGPVFNLDEIVF